MLGAVCIVAECKWSRQGEAVTGAKDMHDMVSGVLCNCHHTALNDTRSCAPDETGPSQNLPCSPVMSMARDVRNLSIPLLVYEMRNQP